MMVRSRSGFLVGVASVVLGACATARTAPAAGDVVLFDFEEGSWRGWTVEGEGFGPAPVSDSTVRSWGPRAPHGAQGRYIAATGDARHTAHPDGRLVSEPFTISRRYLTFLLAGEVHPRVRVALEVDGTTVREAHGNNAFDLVRRGWDVTELRGRRARLVVEDRAAPASLLRVDDFRLSDTAPPEVGSFSVARREESAIVRTGEFRQILDSSGLGAGIGVFHSSVVHGPDGRWHLFGAAGPESLRYTPERVTMLAHATAPALTGPWRWEGPVLTADTTRGEAFVQSPEVVVHDGTFHLYYVAAGKPFGGWKPGECLWLHGKRFVATNGCTHGPFSLHHATSRDGRSWTRHGEVFADSPFVADPSVHRIGQRWVMYYGGAEPRTAMGRHVLAYRTSTDLHRWSEERGIALADTSITTPWPEHPFIRYPVVFRRGGTWYLLAGSINNGNLSRYHVLWPHRSRDPLSFPYASTPQDGRLFVDGGADVLRDADGRWYVTTGNVLAGGVWLAPLHWRDGEPDDDTSIPRPPAMRRAGRTSQRTAP